MRYAAATVAGLTSSAEASSRTVGNRDAAETLPSRIADSMLAAIADDPAPRSISCVSSMMTMYYNKSLARIKTSASRLPRDVWVLQAGMLLSFLGLGLVFPFEIIYLHDVRGFTLPTAGLISATMAGTAIVGGIVAGPTIDRIGARATTLFALGALAAGWGGLAFITRPWEAAVCAMAAGIGNGCALPGTSTMILQMVPRAIRHRGAAIVDEWQALSSPWWGRRIEVRSGDATIEGVARGVDGSGALLLQRDDGEVVRVLAGEARRLRLE